ncbi:MAG: hypothetical protein BGP04_20390 [Rhizobiales bacterium 62-17]|nr:ATP-binding cassette domain-containing protein [Hyphomicrobiales bacterium]OJX99992.1 MAG: hypothetical protein BGP04_20390 [Rhizobiales bacterium 62-17]
MLRLEGLTVGFRADRDVISSIDLSIEAGSTVIITGAAGCGKSTLLAAMSGIIPKLLHPLRMQGAVTLQGTDYRALKPADVFRQVGVVLQAVEDQTWDLTVEDLVAFPLENRGVPQAEVRTRVAAAVEKMGLVELLGRKVRTLSGGERRRVALASALVWQPALLVLDEPTTGLDPDARRRMIVLLQELRAENLTIVIAEQDLAWFDGLADRVVFLADGKVIADQPWSEAIRNTAAFDTVGIEAPFLAHQSCVPTVPTQEPQRLKVEALTSDLCRADKQPVLRSIHLTVGQGEVVGLIGCNGAGKTTLMRALLGLQTSSRGTIAIDGEPCRDWSIAQRARRIGYVPQNLRRMFFQLSVLDEIVFSLSGGQSGAKQVEQHKAAALDLLGRVGLTAKSAESPFSLSNREQLLLAIACVEATEPSLIILDEPLIARDKQWRGELMAFFARCRQAGRGVLLVSHDLPLIDMAADRVLILASGEIEFDGATPSAWTSQAFVRLGWPSPLNHPQSTEPRHALA